MQKNTYIWRKEKETNKREREGGRERREGGTSQHLISCHQLSTTEKREWLIINDKNEKGKGRETQKKGERG